MSPQHGRCVKISGQSITLARDGATEIIELTEASVIQLGDIVEVTGGRARVLTPNRTHTSRWLAHVQDPRRRNGIRVRTQVEAGIREFFGTREFLETRTPLLVPCPGMEPHIRPFRADGLGEGRAFLPTSPEFAMKRLLVGGLERIFQLCPAFRDEPFSTTHDPEFTILEWYRAYSDYESIMRDTEALFEFLARRIFGEPVIPYQGRRIRVAAPWPRLKIRELFQELGVDLVACASRDALAAECRRLSLATASEDTWDDLYFRIWLNLIEPRLPSDQAVFVYRYPPSQAALSVVDADSDGTRWARRFEAYAGGLELANAFEELTDPAEQRRRFVEDMELREKIYGPGFPKNPLDEEFLGALEEGMPPSGGIAMGVDRMVMLFANEPEIAFTTWLRPFSRA
ncbi:MAG: EF-P lysine aminoacylase EpmA [Bdellovibrionota bacterium]